MVITAISRRGTLWQEPEEWVEFRNDSQVPLQLEGWTLQDDERHIFTFPSFVLGPGQYCRVYTNEYHPTSCGFSYWSPSPIWDNVTECAYLKDPYGELISTFCYGFQ
jgi:micrococcal nuclease